MKNKYTFLIAFFCLFTVFSQTEGISYQAVLIDNNPDEIPGVDVPTNNIPNHPITVRFSILGTGGSVEYQETHETQTDLYGTMNLVIGLGATTSASPGGFDEIYWNGQKDLKVDIDLDAGSNFIDFSFQELTFVPFVLHREIIADGVTNLNSDLNVNNNSTSNFSGDVFVEQDTRLNTLTASGESNFYNGVTVDAIMEETNQSDYDAYPLKVQGSDNGIAIKLNSFVPGRESNFMSFWDGAGNPIGRIEGFQALSDVSQGFILDVLLANEPTEDEAKDQDDDDTSPPAPAPSEFDVYLNNDYSLNLLLEYMDLIDTSVAFGANLGACIAGLGIAGDCDDAVWSFFSLFVKGVQISLYISYNEANVGVAFESGGADYAEWLQKLDENEVLAFGDVVGVKAGVISKNLLDADSYMVVSKSPIVSGAMPSAQDKKKYKQVAFLGQVPVKVIGKVAKGNYILPSGNNDGMAISVAPNNMLMNDYKRIVGVAWSEYFGDAVYSYINTAVGINNADLTNVISEMQSVINNMQSALAIANPNYKPTYFDTNAISSVNNLSITKTKPVKNLMMQRYGIDQVESTEVAFSKINDLMIEEDFENDAFKFSNLPYLKEVIANPSEENIKKYNDYYAKVTKRLKEIKM